MELTATKRQISGKRVRTLRTQGITPVNLFGNSVEPLALQCDSSQLLRTISRCGATGLVNLKIEKEKSPRNIMFREIQRDPVTGQILHADMYQVDMDKKIKVEVPVVPVGDAPALKLKENYLLVEMNSIVVECLPVNIPARIDVNVSVLTASGQTIHVKDITAGEGVNIVSNPDKVLMKISLRYVDKSGRQPVTAKAKEETEAAAEVAAKAAPTKAAPAK